jgi:hypothetical protein
MMVHGDSRAGRAGGPGTIDKTLAAATVLLSVITATCALYAAFAVERATEQLEALRLNLDGTISRLEGTGTRAATQTVNPAEIERLADGLAQLQHDVLKVKDALHVDAGGAEPGTADSIGLPARRRLTELGLEENRDFVLVGRDHKVCAANEQAMPKLRDAATKLKLALRQVLADGRSYVCLLPLR